MLGATEQPDAERSTKTQIDPNRDLVPCNITDISTGSDEPASQESGCQYFATYSSVQLSTVRRSYAADLRVVWRQLLA
jgi:hypothetical protein